MFLINSSEYISYLHIRVFLIITVVIRATIERDDIVVVAALLLQHCYPLNVESGLQPIRWSWSLTRQIFNFGRLLWRVIVIFTVFSKLFVKPRFGNSLISIWVNLLLSWRSSFLYHVSMYMLWFTYLIWRGLVVKYR